MYKQLREITNSTLYVYRPLLNQAQLHAWAIEQGFKTTLKDMHVTLAYSRQTFNVEKFHPEVADLKIIDTRDRELKRFGEAIVLRFYSWELYKRWLEIRRLGASWDHPDYAPHVTISYKEPSVSLNKIKPYLGPLIFGHEMSRPFDINAKQKQIISEY